MTQFAGTFQTEARRMFKPTFAPIIRSAAMCRALAGLATFQLACAILHFNAIDCPIERVFGIPCPGCGASRACAALLGGHVREAIRFHSLAPVLLLATIAVVGAALLPARQRQALADIFDAIERRIPLGLIFFSALVIAWLLRLFSGSVGAHISS